jgi:leader peptidase (prepilin peptidase)/N-methyltransferase
MTDSPNDLLFALMAAPPENLPIALVWSLIGLIVGSFLNVVIYRLPVMMEHETDNYLAMANDEQPPHAGRYNLILPGSACTSCGHALSVTDNIPVLSYLWLKGRCRYCHAPVSIRYPLIELMSAALSGLVIWQLGSSLAGVSALMLVWMLIVMAFIDIDTQLLPDELTLPLVWLGLLVNLESTFVPLRDAVIGAALGYMTLWIVYWIFKLVTGKDGIGFGDFKLLAALGAWLGWMMLPLIVLLSSAVGAVIGLSMIAFRGHHRDRPIPFGPYLAAAGLVALLFGKSILHSWLGA